MNEGFAKNVEMDGCDARVRFFFIGVGEDEGLLPVFRFDVMREALKDALGRNVKGLAEGGRKD